MIEVWSCASEGRTQYSGMNLSYLFPVLYITFSDLRSLFLLPLRMQVIRECSHFVSLLILRLFWQQASFSLWRTPGKQRTYNITKCLCEVKFVVLNFTFLSFNVSQTSAVMVTIRVLHIPQAENPRCVMLKVREGHNHHNDLITTPTTACVTLFCGYTHHILLLSCYHSSQIFKSTLGWCWTLPSDVKE